jgi:hypothetical protein
MSSFVSIVQESLLHGIGGFSQACVYQELMDSGRLLLAAPGCRKICYVLKGCFAGV